MIAECRDCGERFTFNPRTDDIRELDHQHRSYPDDVEYPVAFSDVSDADEHWLSILEEQLQRERSASLEAWRALNRKQSVRIGFVMHRDADAARYRHGVAFSALVYARIARSKARRFTSPSIGQRA